MQNSNKKIRLSDCVVSKLVLSGVNNCLLQRRLGSANEVPTGGTCT